jgi:hypothetical protein
MRSRSVRDVAVTIRDKESDFEVSVRYMMKFVAIDLT